jgi:hypothetical protein
MLRTSPKLKTVLAAAALLATAAVVNCSSHQSDVGSVHLALSVPGGYTVNTAGYTVKQGTTTLLGPATFDVSDPNATPSLDIVLPPSTGDTITLTATTTNGHAFSGTSSVFNIVSGQTTLVTVTLTDVLGTPSPADGTLIVNGVIVPNDNPPVIDSVVIAPSQTSVGANIGVTVVAHDPDLGDTLTYAWTATPDGAFAAATSESTTYSSPSVGSKSLKITVTDSRGSSVFAVLPVTVIGGAAGTAGASGIAGAGTAGAGTAGAGTAGAGTAGASGTAGAGTAGAGTAGAGTAGATGTAGAGTAGAGTAGASAPLVLGLFDQTAYLAAADFEINGSDAANEPSCDPSFLTANGNIVDANQNSWGFLTLPTSAQQQASAVLFKAIIDTIGTADAPQQSNGKGAHGWPDGTTPRATGVGTNSNNNGPGPNVHLGGLGGFGVSAAAILGGSLGGELVPQFEAAAIADGLIGSISGLPLTSSSTAADFAGAIAPVTSNPSTAIGLADNIAHCAIAIQITTGTSNAVETLR